MIRKKTESLLTFPKFTFCWFYTSSPKLWHIRDLASQDRIALCNAQVTADISVEVTLERMAKTHCIACAAICCSNVVSFCQPRELPLPVTDLPVAA
jgi:hypothetical protein